MDLNPPEDRKKISVLLDSSVINHKADKLDAKVTELGTEVANLKDRLRRIERILGARHSIR